MIENDLQKAITQALQESQKQGDLPAFDLPKEIPIEHPKQEEMGDYATPICLQLAREARLAPIKIAKAVVKHLPDLPFIGEIQVASPGFINFRFSEAWLASQVEVVLQAAESFGNLDIGHGQRVQVEYVSANPTGQLHVGSARNAVIGDALASVLSAAGYSVYREYYVNDAGSRIRAFQETLYARYAQAFGRDEAVPEDGYMGPYMIELGAEIARDFGDRFLDMPRENALKEIGIIGLRQVLSQAQEDLAMLGIRYNCWFSEQSLYDNGQYEKAMGILREGGYTYEREGATWFKATDFSVSKDEVLVRSNGTPGYFASDVAYHYNKFIERGFDQVIDVWGADHQGHVPRMKAMMQALGLNPARLTIILYQLVTLKRRGEVVRLSKRTGDIITLRELIEEVGPDAVRYVLLSRSADSQMDFDLELAKEQSDENPVYYVQYAHARISSILRFASGIDYSGGDVGLLTFAPELGLIRRMLRLPETIATAAKNLAPHHLAYYAYDLAAAFHAFYRDCRVVSSEPGDEAITKARLKLVAACQIVLARALGLMGMTAPTVM